jgi:hypothetical protein
MNTGNDDKNDDTNDEIGSAPRPGQSGTEGFSPQLAGHAKADHAHTTSFDMSTQYRAVSGAGDTLGGQEESARQRQGATSAAGRILARIPGPTG